MLNSLIMFFYWFRKSRGAISGLFYVYQHKPGFCELFIICSGKQVFLKGNNNDEKIMEDDNGVTVARMRDKITFKDWLDKMFNDKTNDDGIASPSSTTNLGQNNQWEFYLQEIENYYQELMSSNLNEEGDNDESQIGPTETDVTERNISSNVVTKQYWIDIFIFFSYENVKCVVLD